jgi:ribosomal protein L9
MGNELHAANGYQADYALAQSIARDAEKARVASLEQQTRARVAEAAKAAALVAEKSRDTVAQGLAILLDSDTHLRHHRNVIRVFDFPRDGSLWPSVYPIATGQSPQHALLPH